ncbi:hypothetical protein B0T14DRAFT_191091 [Immersiella caudata]|uniref:MYND-type domain-containing protein n=1 Tax=Immersiella caudata TaxID=314043 RepID=A0AA39WYX3_9PEZI|nr:hypothetical protein B0T14DRAFT_191091 [Immersiella caudata]
MSSSTEGIIAPKAGEILTECQVCDAAPPVPLSLCGGCRVVYYCCRNHQLEDRPAHKEACKEIVAAKAEVEKAKRELLGQNPDIFTPGPQNRFYGVFCSSGTGPTQDYIRTLTLCSKALLLVKTQQAVVNALAINREMLRLERRGIGAAVHADQAIAPLLIRLDRDQEAYDFCAWWQSIPERENADWLTSDKERPMLDLHGADPLENMSQWFGEEAVSKNLIRASSVLLILARLFFGFRMALEIQKRSPTLTTAEVLKKTAEVFPIDILQRHPEWLDVAENREKLVKEIVIGANIIASSIGQYNKWYFFFLENPHEKSKRARKSIIRQSTPGSPEEAEDAFDLTHDAWLATPGALDLVMGWAKSSGLRE